MTQEIKILGWLDPEMPGRWKEDGICEFRLKLSGTPSPLWRKSFADHSQSDSQTEAFEKDIVVLPCELKDIEAAIARLQRLFEQTNLVIARQERELVERAVQHKKAEEEGKKKILAAVSNIRFP